MVMYKIDRRGGGAQKSFSRTDPLTIKKFIDYPNLTTPNPEFYRVTYNPYKE